MRYHFIGVLPLTTMSMAQDTLNEYMRRFASARLHSIMPNVPPQSVAQGLYIGMDQLAGCIIVIELSDEDYARLKKGG